MAEILQPTAGQTIVSTDHDHHRHHGGDHNRFDAVEARADFRSLTNEVERFGSLNGDRIKDGFSISGDRVTAVGTAAQLAACRTDGLVQAGFGGVHDRLCDAKAGIVGAVERGFAAEALADCKLSDQIAEAKLATAVGFKDAIIAQNVGFSAATVQAATIGSAAQVLATAFANQATNQATVNFNALTVQAQAVAAAATVQVERVRAELALAQQTGFSAAALLATQLDAQARREADECCCKLTALIIEQGNTTRAQAADFRMRDLEQRLTATQRLIPVTIPVGAG
jgi:hypothetical protein